VQQTDQAAPLNQVVRGYKPRKAFLPLHMRKERFGCIVAHRRAGKTVASVMDLIDFALRCEKPDPRFAYVAPYYAQAKDVAWTYVKRFAAMIPGATINESELRVDLPNGARIRLYGADNYDRLRRIYLDGVVLDEFADQPPQAWREVIRPALSDRQAWALFIGDWWGMPMADGTRIIVLGFAATLHGVRSFEKVKGVA